MSELEQLREQSSYEHGQRIRIEAERNQLRQELAAERKEREASERQWDKESDEQVDKIDRLTEQLAAERESRQDYQGEAYDLNLKLSIVLKALKEIRDAGYTLNRQDGTNVIDAALAVERGKRCDNSKKGR